MKTLFTLVFYAFCIIDVFASSVLNDSVNLNEIVQTDSLIDKYNKENCPKDVVSQLAQQFKSFATLSKLSLPFKSFDCVPVKTDCRSVGMKVHPDVIYDDNLMFSMKSTDRNCMVFLDFFQIGFRKTLLKNKPVDTRKLLVENVLTNEMGQSESSALNYRIGRNKDIDVEKIYNSHVKTYTGSSRLAKNCNADTIYACSFAQRSNVGYYPDSLHKEYNTLNEYKAVYEIAMVKQGHSPIVFFLFCKKEGDKALDKYLQNITKSIQF